MQALTQKTEDYLEAILNVVLGKGYAKTKDVARALDVSPSSVVEMFQKLDSLGLVEYRRYEGVVLTARGRQIAVVIKYRHDTLRNFFLLIGVPEEIADKDACAMEHELSEKSIEQVRFFIEFMDAYPLGKDIARDFSAFCTVHRTPSPPKE